MVDAVAEVFDDLGVDVADELEACGEAPAAAVASL